MTVEECSHGFKYKEQYVVLPAYVGQQVFRLRSKFEYDGRNFNMVGYAIEEGKVSMIQQKVDGSWKIRVSTRQYSADYTVEEFNKYVFLTEAGAEEDRIRLVKKIKAERGISDDNT
jgi:hypothetical protein